MSAHLRRVSRTLLFGLSCTALHAQERPRFVERRHFHVGGGPVEVAAYALDGVTLATAGSGQVAVWERREVSVRELARFSAPDYVSHLAFDPRGRYLAVSGARLQLWDRENGVLDLPERSWCGGPIAWSPDGGLLATCGAGERVVLLRRESFEIVRSLGLGVARSEASALLWESSGDALHIAVGGKRSTLLRYQLGAGVFDAAARREVEGFLTAMSWRDGELALEGRRRTNDGLDVGFDAGHPLGELTLAFTPDERFALLADEVRVAVLEIASGAVRELAIGGPVCAGREGSELLVAHVDGLELWDASRGERLTELTRSWKRYQKPTTISLAPDRQLCLVGSSGGRLLRIDLSGAEPDREARLFGFCDADWSAEGQLGVVVFHGSSPGLPLPRELLLYDAGRAIAPLDDERWPSATAACIAPEGQLIWSSSGFAGPARGTYRRAWPEGRVTKLSEHAYYALRAVAAGAAVGLERQGLHLFDLASGELLDRRAGTRPASFGRARIAASRSGRWVLALAGGGAILLEIAR